MVPYWTILSYLNNNIQYPISIGDLSKQFYISESYICRIFKNATGTTINKYMTARRISPVKKLYLDVEDRKIGGVCSGLAAYFDIDVTLIRIIFLALLIGGGFGFWLYLIFWIVAPKALTPAQKCELRGWEANAETMAKFTDSSKR